MKYLFFDIECANCFNNAGKICSFGYVLTDDNFNIIEKNDIVINPKAKFDYRGLKMGGIELAYTEKEFRNAPDFGFYYPKIKALMTGKNVIVFGHGTVNDAKFILGECDRYNKEPFDYIYVDTCKLIRRIYKREKDLSLSVLYNEFYPDEASLIAHNSEDDAFMTMKLAQYICKDKGLTLSKLISQNTIAKGEVFLGRTIDNDTSVFSYSKKNNKTKNSNAKVFEQAKKEQIINKTGKYFRKYLCIESDYEKNNFAQMLLIMSKLNDLGIKYVSNITYADIYVEADSAKREFYLPKRAKSISFEELFNIIGITKQELITKNIDCGELIGNFSSNKKWYGKYKESHILLDKIDDLIDEEIFECSIDFPVIQFLLKEKGSDEKIYRFFDPVINGIFTRHPYRVNRAENSYLPQSVFDKAVSDSVEKVISKVKRSGSENSADNDIFVEKTYNYITSYKFLGKFEANKITFTLYNKIIADTDFEKSIKINKEAIELDLNKAIKQYYSADLFAKALQEMSKFKFGYKDNIFSQVLPLKNIKVEKDDRILLPKKYYEEFIKVDSCVDDGIIKNEKIYIPVLLGFENNLFEEKLALPAVIERRIND